jgi:hypothetical protein
VAFYDIRDASRANWDTFIASLDDDLADSPAAINAAKGTNPLISLGSFPCPGWEWVARDLSPYLATIFF